MAQLNEESVQEIAAEGQEVELTPEQKKEQLGKLMADGKRELRANNLETASQKFGEAAEFAAQQYGPLAEESFEPNFMYGRVLVMVSEVENDVFKTTLVNMVKKDDEETEEQDGNESMTEEEKEDVREMVADALTENAEELEKKKSEGTGEESKEEKTDEKAQGDKAEEESKEEKAEDSKEEKAEEKIEEDTKDEKTEEETKEEKEPTDESAAGTGKEEDEKMEEAAENEKDEAMEDGEAAEETIEDGDEEDEEEDLDNNQLAWESLEVAKNIADKMIAETSSSEWKMKKADVFVQLAQCTALDEKYEQALEELGQAGKLIAEITRPKGDRLTSEIFFHEGRINRLRNEFALAEESFNKAAGAMETCLEEVKADAGSTPTEDQTKEMEDLVAIIKDFKDRAEDSKESAAQKQLMATEKEKEKTETPTILTSSNGQTDSTANDISSLVRKKRVHDESEAEGAPKRSKSEGVEEMGDENVAV